jgi:hypothetical protein
MCTCGGTRVFFDAAPSDAAIRSARSIAIAAALRGGLSSSAEIFCVADFSAAALFPGHLPCLQHLLSCRRRTGPVATVENVRLTRAVKNRWPTDLLRAAERLSLPKKGDRRYVGEKECH